MASVYLARDLKHDRAVAVKVLRPELGALLGAERFLREIKVVARLQHPHILPLYDSGEADEALYYVMPYAPGDSLRDRIRRERRMALRDALRIAREVADALHYAHGNDIIHRDIKPENILLSGEHAMVADFGIARAVHVAGGERWETLTDSGVAVGTPAYMSPEQTAGDRDLDGRSDIFSLGCVVYEMLAGIPPFTGPDGEVMIARRFTDPAPVLRMVRDDVPESVDLAVQRALAREPAERFANALEFTEAIWDDTGAVLRRQRAGHDEKLGTPRRSGRLATKQQTSEPESSAPGGHNSNWKAAGMMAVVVALAATAATLLIVKSPPSHTVGDAANAAPAASGVAASGAGARVDSVLPGATTPGQSAGVDSSTDAVGAGETTRPLPTPGAGAEVASGQPAEGESQPSAPTARPVPQRVRPEPQAQIPVPTAPGTDSVLASLRDAAHAARSRAVSDGATQADLSLGDSLERAAVASAAGGRATDAMTQLVSASAAWGDASRAAKSRAAQRALASESTAAAKRAGAASAPSAASESASAAPSLAEQRAAIADVIESYGRAIEARDMAAIRKVYPGITAAQQRDWQQFFSTVQNVKVSLAVAQLDITGATADARIAGTYTYANTSTRRSEEQRVSFRATLRRDAGAWRLTAIR
jgi:serine/threonine protein kinase